MVMSVFGKDAEVAASLASIDSLRLPCLSTLNTLDVEHSDVSLNSQCSVQTNIQTDTELIPIVNILFL